MSDDQNSNPDQPDPLESGGEEQDAETDLDAMLAEASSLADELTNEVGTVPPSTSSTSSGTTESTADSPPVEETQASTSAAQPSAETSDIVDGGDLDAELAELERLVSETQDQLGSATEKDERSDSPQDSSSENNPSAVPDFMSEFTDPDPAPGSPPTQASASDPPTPTAQESPPIEDSPSPNDDAQILGKPTTESKLASKAKEGAVGTATLGVVGTPMMPDPTKGAVGTIPAVSPLDPLIGPDPDAGPLSKLKSLAIRMEPVAHHVASIGVSLLERTDKVCSRISPKTRRYLGYAAIANLGTAVIVYFVSLF